MYDSEKADARPALYEITGKRLTAAATRARLAHTLCASCGVKYGCNAYGKNETGIHNNRSPAARAQDEYFKIRC